MLFSILPHKYLAILSFQLFNRRAVLSLQAFNLLDVGYELSEYVWSGGTRDAVELTIPKSIRLTFSLEI